MDSWEERYPRWRASTIRSREGEAEERSDERSDRDEDEQRGHVELRGGQGGSVRGVMVKVEKLELLIT